MLSFANRESLPDMLEACQDFVLENFETLSRDNAFYDGLEKTDFINFLQNDDLAVFDEQTVFRAIVKWSEINRPQDATELFAHLRVGCLSEEFKTSTLNRHPVYKSFLEARYISQLSDCHNCEVIYQILFNNRFDN